MKRAQAASKAAAQLRSPRFYRRLPSFIGTANAQTRLPEKTFYLCSRGVDQRLAGSMVSLLRGLLQQIGNALQANRACASS